MDGAGIVFLLLMLLGGAVGIGAFILWLWMLIDCATKEPSDGNDKIIWILVIVLTHWIGALIYLIFRRPERMRVHGQ